MAWDWLANLGNIYKKTEDIKRQNEERRRKELFDILNAKLSANKLKESELNLKMLSEQADYYPEILQLKRDYQKKLNDIMGLNYDYKKEANPINIDLLRNQLIQLKYNLKSKKEKDEIDKALKEIDKQYKKMAIENVKARTEYTKKQTELLTNQEKEKKKKIDKTIEILSKAIYNEYDKRGQEVDRKFNSLILNASKEQKEILQKLLHEIYKGNEIITGYSLNPDYVTPLASPSFIHSVKGASSIDQFIQMLSKNKNQIKKEIINTYFQQMMPYMSNAGKNFYLNKMTEGMPPKLEEYVKLANNLRTVYKPQLSNIDSVKKNILSITFKNNLQEAYEDAIINGDEETQKTIKNIWKEMEDIIEDAYKKLKATGRDMDAYNIANILGFAQDIPANVIAQINENLGKGNVNDISFEELKRALLEQIRNRPTF